MKLWGGRFDKDTNNFVNEFQSSIKYDKRLYKQDILGSIAHGRMLGAKGIITVGESDKIIKGLKEIFNDIESDKVKFKMEAEDIHMNIECLLIEKIGDLGRKLHTGRSRNDQVALDTRLYLKEEIDFINELLKDLCLLLLDKAEKNIDLIIPGYTHLQKAQPITLGHSIMAYYQMFKRDIERFKDCYKRTDVMPLGSCALAGTTYNLDREMTARDLNFGFICENSIDGVGDRDFAIEFLSCCSILMMHFSRFCEELIIWNSDEFGFIEIDDSMGTGSSIMPQKKNPDVAELIRGKTGRVYGDLMALLTVMKGLPLAYNKDMQEDKEALFDASDTVKDCISAFILFYKSINYNKENINLSLKKGFLNATDAADYLTRKGIPFRSSHEIVGNLVNYCIKNCKALDDLTIKEFKEYSQSFEEDIYSCIDLRKCVKNRNTFGGTSPTRVMEMIISSREYIKAM